MDTITVNVTPADITTGVVAFLDGARLQDACPLATVAQRQLERVVRVFAGAWHLAARDKVPATAGEPLPAQAVAFVVSFDAWAKAVKEKVRAAAISHEEAIRATPGRPAGLTVDLVVPSKAMKAAA